MESHFMLPSFPVLLFLIKWKLNPMTRKLDPVLLKLISVGSRFILLFLEYFWFVRFFVCKGSIYSSGCDCNHSILGLREAGSNMWLSQ